ncbi:hypothetical protein LCGC14_0894000 [marine sediment metagenome]|uniref:Uncharacterized protein n=1 Tax=marine sediment metagenome TaxID=412755 RepID=A0A0F9S5B8_9ZZZZ
MFRKIVYAVCWIVFLLAMAAWLQGCTSFEAGLIDYIYIGQDKDLEIIVPATFAAILFGVTVPTTATLSGNVIIRLQTRSEPGVEMVREARGLLLDIARAAAAEAVGK